MKNKRIISIIITLLIITLISSVGFTKVLATENVSNELVNDVTAQDGYYQIRVVMKKYHLLLWMELLYRLKVSNIQFLQNLLLY